MTRDERGMILVVALPMALLVLACLCYLASVGDGILYRERLQDTADATAWQSAVLHARGMNTIAALNMLQLALPAPDGASALAGPGELAPRLELTATVIRQTQLAVAEAAPQLAIARASADNTAFYRTHGAAESSIALSHAALAARDQDALTVDRADTWLLTPRRTHEASPSVGEQASDPGRLPVEVKANLPCITEGACAAPLLRIASAAQNGNVLMQTWAVARGRARERVRPGDRGLSALRWLVPVTVHAEADAFAQAEFFFDCDGAWAQCEADAALVPRWTARLRRVRAPATHQTPSVVAAFQRQAERLRASLCRSSNDCPPSQRPDVAALFALPDSPER